MSNSSSSQAGSVRPQPAEATRPKSLDGIRVLDLSWLIPGPFCTNMLTELGADVIKVERPDGGDYMREDRPAEFESINRGKRSIVLDLKCDAGKQLLYDLCRNADVVVEGFRPGVAKRLGIDYDTLSAQNPRIVYLSLSGYGQTGPYEQRPGHDLNYMATTGALGIPGRWGDSPQRFGLPIGDLSSALYGVINIQAALAVRERTGRGAYIDLAISDALLHWAQVRLADAWRQPPQEKNATQQWWIHLDPAQEVYGTSDGHKVAIALAEHKFAAAFRGASGTDGPEYDDTFDTRSRCTPEGALRFRQVVGELIASRSYADWETLLTKFQIPLTRVAQPHEVLADDHFRSRGLIVPTTDANGAPTTYVPMPGLVSSGPAASPTPAPSRGQHTQSVLHELCGIDPAQFDALKEKHVVE